MLARSLLKTLAPPLYRRISYHRNEGRLRRIARSLIRLHGPHVLAGPFQGMKLPPPVAATIYNPMLVGSYEAELHPIIESVIARDCPLVVNIGCAQGYYAVGLLRRLPRCRCIAFDLDPAARDLCHHLAQANGVADRLELHPRCDSASLAAALRPSPLAPGAAARKIRYAAAAASPSPPREERDGERRPFVSNSLCRDTSPSPPFVLSDCEGAECDLLDPARVPALTACDLLVELHDFLVPNATDTIRDRFSPSHRLQLIPAMPKDPARYPALAFLPPAHRALAVHEHRPDGMHWVWLQPIA